MPMRSNGRYPLKNFDLKYGLSSQSISLSEKFKITLIEPPLVTGTRDPVKSIQLAVEHPLNFTWNSDYSGKQVAITVNDKTRPVPNHLLLPPLIDKLKSSGVSNENITIWIASGSHTPMQPEEFSKILPKEIYSNYTIKPHDATQVDNLVELGATPRGTPVFTNASFYYSDLKIVVGDIEPHHFAGFSGGYKSASIGLGGLTTINRNHSLLTQPGSTIGEVGRNPLRQDIEDIGRMIGVDLALNAILNTDKAIVSVLFGHPEDVFRAGIQKSKEICTVSIPALYDIVVASAGGYPKDINFYQAQKALTHASCFCKEGGTIILVAECIEGTGSRAYEDFMQNKTSLDSVFRAFADFEFRVGPHKAIQMARLLDKHNIVLVSSIISEMVRTLLMHPAQDVQSAFDQQLARTIAHHPNTGELSVAILPNATTTAVLS